MKLEEKITIFLGKSFDLNGIDKDDNIFEKGLVNSLFAMQLVNFLESEFDIVISNDELELDNFKSINLIVNLVKTKLS